MGVSIAQEGTQSCLEICQVGVETTKSISHSEKVTVDNTLDHGDLCRSLEGATLNFCQRCSLVNGDCFDKTAQLSMEWETNISELLGPPRHYLVDEPFGRGLVVGEPLVVRRAKSITVAQFTRNAELPDANNTGFFQGVPDGGAPASGHELRQVIVFQVNEAVTPTQMDPTHIDPVQEKLGVVSEVPQLFGQMYSSVERVRHVEDDPPAEFLGWFARSLGNSRSHDGHPVVEHDRQSLTALKHYPINYSLNQELRFVT
jgi:hypothetical protein